MRGLFVAIFALLGLGFAQAESHNPRMYSQDVRYEFPGGQEGREGCYYDHRTNELRCPQPDDCYYNEDDDVYTCPSGGPVARVCHWSWEYNKRWCEYIG